MYDIEVIMESQGGLTLKQYQVILSVLLILALAAAIFFGIWLESGEGESTQMAAVEMGQIIITEVCGKNDSIIANNDGKYPDYIELYNSGDDINLQGFYLTDGKKTSEPFGDVVLATGEYRLILIEKETLNFSIGASGGDCVQLKDTEGHTVAEVTTVAMQADQVMVYSDGKYVLTYDASPGFADVAAFREGTETTESAVVLNEVLAENVSSLPDKNGNFSDVVELYNASSESVCLGGWYLSDSVENRFRYRLPEITLAPGEYLLIFCDGENDISESGEIHANFGLSLGETLCLTDRTGGYMTLTVENIGEDVSLSRTEEGTYEASMVSLGYPNDEIGCEAFLQSRVNEDSPLVISEVLLSSADVPYRGGIQDVVEICNISKEAVSTEGWYLSDGGDPYKYALPKRTLAPGECLVVLCGDGTGEEFTGFSLSSDDVLRLTAPDYRYAPMLSCNASETGKSIVLEAIDGESCYVMGEPSLGYANSAESEALYLQETLPLGLRFSEMMSSNESYLKGAYGTTCDWLEIYNASAEDIRLCEYYLSDNSNSLYRYQLPDQTLAAGEYCVILLSKDGTNLSKNYPVLPMNLSQNGETLYLTKNGEIVDYVFLPALKTDTSYGRAEGEAAFSLLASVTPGKANGAAAQISEAPVALTPQGVYDDVESITVELSAKGTIYYTTDCSKPSTASQSYTDPIELTQTTVIRMICCEEGKSASEVVNLTYVINEYDELPVACLVAESSQLFSDTNGIMVEGLNVPADEAFPYTSANYWWDVERKATVSLFETDGSGFTANCGIKVFGGYSRALPKKSLAVFFRNEYGVNTLNYQLFGEEGLDSYESFVFRACGQDSLRAMMRDPMISSLVATYTDVAVQKYKAVDLYINGRYWGIYYIREKINENYVAGNFNADKDDVALCGASGTANSQYAALINYVRNHDLSDPECYAYVCSQVDVDEYMDYIIAEMWIGNADNGNIKFCKTTEGKWTWIMYDVDYAFYYASYDAVSDHLNPNGTGSGDMFPTILIRNLLKNAEFKDAFLRRMAWQMNTIWTEETLLPWIDAFEKMIETDMEKDCDRWSRTYSAWRSNVEDLRTFAKSRNAYMLDDIQSYFGLSTEQMREYGFDV